MIDAEGRGGPGRSGRQSWLPSRRDRRRAVAFHSGSSAWWRKLATRYSVSLRRLLGGNRNRDTAFSRTGRRFLNRCDSMLDTDVLASAPVRTLAGDIGLDSILQYSNSTVPNPIQDPSQLDWLVKKINTLNSVTLPAGSFPANAAFGGGHDMHKKRLLPVACHQQMSTVLLAHDCPPVHRNVLQNHSIYHLSLFGVTFCRLYLVGP